MIPIGPLLALLAREALRSRERRAGAPEAASEPNVSTTLLIWIFAVPIGFALGGAVAHGAFFLIPPLLLCVALLFPGTVARAIGVRFGLPRFAYYVASVPSLAFARDPAGGAAIAAAWALCRQRTIDEGDAEFVAQRVSALLPVRSAGLVAAGLLAAAHGDLESARALLRGSTTFDPNGSPDAARRIASDWLAADAAERGAWRELIDGGAAATASSEYRFTTGRQAWLLGGVARALLLEPGAPRGAWMWLRWLLAPGRLASKPLVQRALAALDGEFLSASGDDEAPPPFAAPDLDALGRAMSLHAAVSAKAGRGAGASARVRPTDLRVVAQAWDEVLEGDALVRAVEERAAALGGGDARETVAKLRADVDADLIDLAMTCEVPLAYFASTLGTTARVRAGVRDRLLRDVEAASDALRRRTDERRALPGADEWREWDALERLYARGVALAGDDFRSLAFYKVNPDATHLAVWLYNERKEHAIANAIFRFCLAEAEAVGDEAAIALQRKNVGCGS